MPNKLKVLLIIWAIYGLLWTLVLGGILIYGIVLSFIGQNPNPFPYNIIIFIIVLLIVLPGVFVLKLCRDLWKGKASADLPLRIFAGLNLLSVPFGTALGIATFIILSSREVQTYLNKGIPPITKQDLINEIKSVNPEAKL